jgi:predicted esterase
MFALLVISFLFLTKAEADMVKVKGLGNIEGIIERETEKTVKLRVETGKIILNRDEIVSINKASKEENELIRQKWGIKGEGTQKLQKYTSKTYITKQRGRPGKISIMRCDDNIHSYAVRLPSDYGQKESYPVLFCFDPGGDGNAAVRNFAFASDLYGWIVVGSLDAKNGPWKPILKAQEAMLKDIKNRYTVDQDKYYAAGFSGGAGMSYTIAYNNPNNFKGVIACGGGLGQGKIAKNIAVYHCVGKADRCAIKEIKKVYKKLERKGVASRTHIFVGGHSYPPNNVLRDAVSWIASR